MVNKLALPGPYYFAVIPNNIGPEDTLQEQHRWRFLFIYGWIPFLMPTLTHTGSRQRFPKISEFCEPPQIEQLLQRYPLPKALTKKVVYQESKRLYHQVSTWLLLVSYRLLLFAPLITAKCLLQPKPAELSDFQMDM